MVKIIAFIVLLTFISCNQRDKQGCFENLGNVMVKDFPINAVDSIQLAGDFDIEFGTDSVSKLELRGYENRLKNFDIEIKGKSLYISEELTCRWNKNHKKRSKLILSVPDFKHIYCMAHGYHIYEIKTDTFSIHYSSSSAKVILQVNALKSEIKSIESYNDLTVYGCSTEAYYFISLYSILSAQNHEVKRLHAVNKSSGDLHVKFVDNLGIELLNSGNIFYNGDPNLIQYYDTSGTGKVLKKE